MKIIKFIILISILPLAHSTNPLPKQINTLVQSINMYLDRTEQELDSDHKTKINLAKRQLENAHETLAELFSNRYKDKFDQQHPEILKCQKRVKKLESRLALNTGN
jgi:hypothetical protein